MRKILWVLPAVLLATWLWHSHGATHAPRPADGELVTTPPMWPGLSFSRYTDYISYGSLQTKPLSGADLLGRVLSVRQYPPKGFGECSHTDLVLGRGPMSDNRVVDHLKITQSDRGMDIEPDASAPIARALADDLSINVSIYSDDFTHSAILDAIRVGDVVRIVGWRMSVRDASGASWEGGSGHDRKGQHNAVIQVLKLQVNDERKFGNWSAPADS